MKPILFSSIMFLAFSACSTFDRVVQKPSVELDSVNLEDPSLTALTMVFGVRVDNPNNFTIPVSALNYELRLNGNDLAKGVFDDPGKIPARGNAVVKIPVRVSYFSLYKTARSIQDKRAVSYEIKGDIDAAGITVPFNETGTVDLPKTTLPSE